MEENRYFRPKGRAEHSDALRPVRVCLISETPSGSERFAVSATAAEKAAGPVYTFEHGGARFCVAVGETVRIGREGDFVYEPVLDPRAETKNSLRTPYGESGARVRVHDLQCVREGETLSLECVYVLDFSGDRQQHRLRFSARPQSARGKEMV